MPKIVAKSRQDELSRIKDTVKKSYEYFKHNYDRYNEFRKFIFESSLRPEDISLLMNTGRPQLEFNVLEAYISRLLGEFSKQMPGIIVSADDENNADPMTIKIVEQHLRHVLSDDSNHHVRYEIYKDILSGGFSVGKITTSYASPMSFNQVINIERVYDPTLCGFDQTAILSHKGDGRFCFECFPMRKDEFEEEYPDVPIENLTFNSSFGGFNWAYLNDNTEILLVVDFYEKKKKKIKIIQTIDGKTMTSDDYDNMIKNWDKFIQPPAIRGKPRITEIDVIVRYRVIENSVLEYTETDFNYFPLIFIDGNSVIIKSPKNGNIRQLTRPYVYHAKGAQKLKNYAGISLANEIESTIQHKFMVAKESLPKEDEFLEAYKDVQKANVLVYNQFYENNPDQIIPNPVREIARQGAPPEIFQGFTGADQLIQNILGSYDASLGINNNQLSGIAIVEAASQSNAAAMPYIVGYLQGLQRLAQVYVDLLPKYYITPRTIPIMNEEGKRSIIKINDPNGPQMVYNQNSLNVKVEAGASFSIQKSRTIMMIKEMMGMSPLFSQFIGENGLNFILDNMEGRGIDQLKKMVEDWTKELKTQKQVSLQNQQAQSQNNPAMIKAQIDMKKLEQESLKNQNQFQIDMNKLQQDERKILSDLEIEKTKSAVQLIKANTEKFSKEVDLKLAHHNSLMKEYDMHNRHNNELTELHHKIMDIKNSQ